MCGASTRLHTAEVGSEHKHTIAIRKLGLSLPIELIKHSAFFYFAARIVRILLPSLGIEKE